MLAQGDAIGDPAALDHDRTDLEDFLMGDGVEIGRAKDIRNTLEGIVVIENGAEHTCFGREVMRRLDRRRCVGHIVHARPPPS